MKPCNGNKRLNFNDKKDIEKISKRIRISFKKYMGRFKDPQDCIQEILTRMLEGRHKHATIDQAVIDYLRTTYGAKRVSSNAQRQNFEYAHSFESLTDARLFRISNGNKPSDRLDIIECKGFITNQIDKAILMLFYIWGLNEIEIGDIFGFSESRVSQRLQRIQKCISTRIKAQESKDKRKTKNSMEKLLSKETNGDRWRVEQFSFERMEIGKSWSMEAFNEESF